MIKLEKLIVYLMCMGVFFLITQFDCRAVSISETYGSYFQEDLSEDIAVQKTNDNDRQILKDLISKEDKDFAMCLGCACIDADDMMMLDDKVLSLTIRDHQKNVVGEVTLTEGSIPDQLNVGYWIGKDFRGKGYAHLAVHKVMSKIWESDSNVVFEFWINDTNIPSIKVVEKLSYKLNVNLEKLATHKVEWKLRKIDNEESIYNYDFYYDNVLCFSTTTQKEKLIKFFSEESISSGILCSLQRSVYIMKK